MAPRDTPRGAVGLSRRAPRLRPTPRPLSPPAPQSAVRDGGGGGAGAGEALAAPGRGFPGGESLSRLLSPFLLLPLSLSFSLSFSPSLLLFLPCFPAGGGPAPPSPP